MRRFIYLIVLLVVSANAEPEHHHDHHDHNAHDCHGKECDLVNQAIENIGMYFDEHLCHAFKNVQCQNHVLQNDEVVCGSDGRTYQNHCQFAKARCQIILDKDNYYDHMLQHPLKIVNYGACFVTTVSTPSTSASLTMAAITTGSGTTSKPAVTSAKTLATTTATPVTTTVIMTTTMSIHNLLGSVFCQYKDAITCTATLNVVCGSDGNFYPNSCELLKLQCADPTLRTVSDASQCSLSP